MKNQKHKHGNFDNAIGLNSSILCLFLRGKRNERVLTTKCTYQHYRSTTDNKFRGKNNFEGYTKCKGVGKHIAPRNFPAVD